jgi:hypothetical protein
MAYIRKATKDLLCAPLCKTRRETLAAMSAGRGFESVSPFRSLGNTRRTLASTGTWHHHLQQEGYEGSSNGSREGL